MMFCFLCGITSHTHLFSFCSKQSHCSSRRESWRRPHIHNSKPALGDVYVHVYAETQLIRGWFAARGWHCFVHIIAGAASGPQLHHPPSLPPSLPHPLCFSYQVLMSVLESVFKRRRDTSRVADDAVSNHPSNDIVLHRVQIAWDKRQINELANNNRAPCKKVILKSDFHQKKSLYIALIYAEN